MKTTTALLLLFITNLAFGQIDKNLQKANWKIGNEMIVNGNTILRLEGRNDIGGILNVGYTSCSQLLAETEQLAEKQMWTTERKEEKKELYEKYASGGIIDLYITRLTIDAANTDMFTIIVKDSTDSNEILRKDLEGEIPMVPSSGSDYWWNYTTVIIPNPTKGKIYIYVIDNLGGDNNKFKFEVKL
jgi:hypothetical protein